ncbi:hypothetical protein [Streptomyces bottropensis]|uniref:hypothetical protein n=1 Tax=Streptomyces bottropensis TaxID=42235 RepID=UPI003690CEF6
MTTPRFIDRVEEQSIPLSKILLDPNNPRLIGLDGYEGVPESRATEENVQINTLNKLNDHRAFDQESLRSSIEKSSLLPIDRIVVRPVKGAGGEDLYILVEGNRRIAACKTLMQQHLNGEKTLDPHVFESIENPSVLVLAQPDAAEARLDQWVIQGIRHISGIRPWGAYQAAKTIEAMITKLGYAEGDVAGALSISVQRVRRSMRVLGALQQMSETEYYGEFAGPETYTYFDEALKRPAVRSWLGWSNDQMAFDEDEKLEQFYIWITPDDELDGRRRIPVAESIRKLDSVLKDSAALDVLNQPGNTIDDALRVVAPQTPPDWTEPLQRAIKALDTVPISDLENMTDDNFELISKLIDLAERRKMQATSFKA